MLKSRIDLEELLSEVFLLRVSKVFVFSLVSSGEFPESVKINETVDFVGGNPFLAIFNLLIANIAYLSQIYIFYKSNTCLPGDLDDDIEFDDVDSEGSGSDEGDDIDGI